MNSKIIFGALFVALCISQVAQAEFAWGTATAAYQIEGAWNIDGKGLNIWDVYTSYPGLIYQNQSGQIADDFYHKFQDDIDMMAKLKIKHFRMSIAWSRVLPNGTVDNVNQQGVDFYNKVFNALLAKGIQPWVTLYHWDLPAALNNKSETGGWLNPDIVNKFNDYADFCFKTFGDRVKHWITLNEIQEFTWGGYGGGGQAPGRCSPSYQAFCKEVGGGGNSGTEPYIAAHHALLCHGIAVQTYRTKYATQAGQIGITIDSSYAEPFDPNNPLDVQAVDTYLSFKYGWLADPIVFGKYPDIMVQYITDNRLPTFTAEQSKMMKGSFDFLGLNHYTTRYVRHTGVVGTDYSNDYRLEESVTDVNGHQIGPKAGNAWLYVYPQGMRKIVNWISKRYGNPALYIFENGCPCPNENDVPKDVAIKDTFRVNYLKDYIANLIQAKITDKVNMAGYFVWSMLDNFEWSDGFSVRFGLTYVDYNNATTRYLKDSAYFYSTIIQASEPLNQLKGHKETEEDLAHLFSITERF